MTIPEARSAFEQHLLGSRRDTETSYTLFTDFTPRWNMAVACGNGGFSSVDVPIIADRAVHVSIGVKIGNLEGSIRTTLQQKLTVERENGLVGIYLMTMVPGYGSLKSSIDDFHNAGDKGGFCGRMLYSDVTDGRVVHLDIYDKGVRIERITALSNDDWGQYEKIYEAMADVTILGYDNPVRKKSPERDMGPGLGGSLGGNGWGGSPPHGGDYSGSGKKITGDKNPNFG